MGEDKRKEEIGGQDEPREKDKCGVKADTCLNSTGLWELRGEAGCLLHIR